MGKLGLGAGVAACLAALLFLVLASGAWALTTHAPELPFAQGEDCPFPLAAPWPTGETWMAGNGGSYYGEGAHQGSEYYAVDFNRIDGPALGQPIYAAADGLVIWSGWLDGYGNCVMLSHRFGVVTTYAHFVRPPSVSVGQTVTTATVLGYCGSTGNSTGPHLHFSVRIGDISLKPEPMEGRDLFDGIYIVAGPKPEAAGRTPLLADLLRTPQLEAGEPALSGQWAGTLAAAPAEARASGGRTAHGHLPW